jgi:hypothetical protein
MEDEEDDYNGVKTLAQPSSWQSSNRRSSTVTSPSFRECGCQGFVLIKSKRISTLHKRLYYTHYAFLDLLKSL